MPVAECSSPAPWVTAASRVAGRLIPKACVGPPTTSSSAVTVAGAAVTSTTVVGTDSDSPAATASATARVLRLLDVQDYRNVLIPGVAALFIGACLVHDWRKHRVVHRVYVIGGLVIVASWPLRQLIGHSAWYFPIGEGVARIARAIF